MEKKITAKTQLQFGFFQACTVFAVTIPMMYITYFLTANAGMSAAVMGTVLLVARIVDFFLGLAAGGIIEKSRMKWGTYRSWLIILKYTVFAGVVFMFWDTSSMPMGLKAAFAIIGYILMHGSMDFWAVSQYGIIERRAGIDMGGRSQLSIAYARGMTVANIIISAVALPLIVYFGGVLNNANLGYLVVAAFFAMFIFIGSVTLVKTTKEFDLVKTAEETKNIPQITLGDMVKGAAGNGQLMLLLLVFCLNYIGMFTIQTVMQYYFAIIIKDMLMMSLSLTISMVFAFAGSVIGPSFGKKFGKKAALWVGVLLYGIFGMLITFLAKNSVWVYIILGGLSQFVFYMYFSFGMNYFLDAGEFGFYKTGKDNRNVALSIYNMPMKIGMMLGGVIGAYGLAIIGLDAVVAKTASAAQFASFVSGFMPLTGVIPGAFSVVAALLALLFYKITDEDAEKYAKANAEKLAAQKSGAEV